MKHAKLHFPRFYPVLPYKTFVSAVADGVFVVKTLPRAVRRGGRGVRGEQGETGNAE